MILGIILVGVPVIAMMILFFYGIFEELDKAVIATLVTTIGTVMYVYGMWLLNSQGVLP